MNTKIILSFILCMFSFNIFSNRVRNPYFNVFHEYQIDPKEIIISEIEKNNYSDALIETIKVIKTSSYEIFDRLLTILEDFKIPSKQEKLLFDEIEKLMTLFESGWDAFENNLKKPYTKELLIETLEFIRNSYNVISNKLDELMEKLEKNKVDEKIIERIEGIEATVETEFSEIEEILSIIG